MTLKLIQQGAEAKIFLDKEKNLIIKDRLQKSYRHSGLDKQIRKRRTKSEIKLLEKARKIINIPKLNEPKDFDKISMEYIEGKKLSEHLNKFSLNEQKEIMKKIGESVGNLHKENIIHGDLTTSNMILKKNKLFFIDFGLGYISEKTEDKAVDLHLLKEALEAKHFENWKILFDKFFLSYEKVFGKRESQKIFDRIKVIEKRGRYRH